MTISAADFTALIPRAESNRARQEQVIADTDVNAQNIASNLSQINFVKDNSDPAAIDSITELLNKAATDDTSILQVVTDNSAVAAQNKADLEQAIAALNSLRINELAAKEAELDQKITDLGVLTSTNLANEKANLTSSINSKIAGVNGVISTLEASTNSNISTLTTQQANALTAKATELTNLLNSEVADLEGVLLAVKNVLNEALPGSAA